MAKADENAQQAAAPAAQPEIKTEAPAAAPLVMTQEQLNQIIAAATSATKAEVMGEMVKLLAGQKTEGAADTSNMISDLAMAIAGMSDQGGNRRIIPPAEADRRKAAQARMGELLNQIAADSTMRPHYKLVNLTWLDGQLLQAQVPDGEKWKYNEIIWRGAPNSAMRPVNAIAKEVYGAYLESIGGTTKDQSGVREHPTWVGNGGLLILGNGSATAQAHGLVIDPAQPATLGAELPSSQELTSTDDLNATRIPILGKTFAPAERTAPGKVSTLQFPNSN